MISMMNTAQETSTGLLDTIIDTVIGWCLNTGVKILIALVLLFVSAL